MAPDNWLPPEELFIVQPKTPQGVDNLAEDIHTLARLLPTYEPDFLEAMREYPDVFTLVYHNDRPVGYIETRDSRSEEVAKETLLFGGAVLPEYRDKGLTQTVSPAVIRNAFSRLPEKKKILAETESDNSEARHALSALGFVFYGIHEGKARYKMTREAAIGRRS